MKKIAALAVAVAVVLAFTAVAAFAASGKVTAVDGQKVTLSAKGTGFKNGEMIMIKSGEDYVSGTVTSLSGDSLTVQLKRKAAFVTEGKSVTLEKKGSAAMQGC
jgi:translation initiation factor 2 gamma subunit (eIF-2gamma)